MAVHAVSSFWDLSCRLCGPGESGKLEKPITPHLQLHLIGASSGCGAELNSELLAVSRQVGIYFPLYDALAAELAKGSAGAQAPLVAGAVARTAAVLFTSPLELVRTRMQVRIVNTK